MNTTPTRANRLTATTPYLLWPTGAPYAVGDTTEDRPAITPYLVDSPSPTSAIIVCPGGGYWGRAEHEGEPVAQWLNSLGISAFVLRYRVKPYQHPVPLMDAQRAVRTVRAMAGQWNIDPSRVGVLGFSAGGHLTASVGTHYDLGDTTAADPVERQSCRPDLLVLCYAVVSFLEFMHQGSREALLGDDAPQQLLEWYSLERQVTTDTPPTFLWHTAEDTGVPPENSIQFALALSKNHVPYALHVFEKGEHGLGLSTDFDGARLWTSVCAQWLQGHGFS